MLYIYSRLPVIRTCTYSNNLVIRTEMAFPLDLLTQLRQKHSRLFELQLFELSVIRTDFYSSWGQLQAKSPSVIRTFIIGRSSNENINFLRLKHFLLQKISFQYSCPFTLFKLFEQFLQKFNILLRTRELKQTGDSQSLIISKVSSFPFDFESTQYL